MKPLLKAADAPAQANVRHLTDRIHALNPVAGIPSDPEPAPPSAEALRIAKLEERNAALAAQLEQASEAAPRREEEAFERGLAEGAKRAVTREDDRQAALAEGLAAAQEEFSACLARLDILALEVAQTALARIFGDETLYSGMVAATLRRQMADIEQIMAIRACVSPADFPDERALVTLAGGLPGLDVTHDPALAAGDCRIDLRLGRIEAGIGKQWTRLSALIDDLAQEEAAA